MKEHYTLAEIAELTKAKLIGDPEYTIRGVESLETAKETEASFLENPKYEQLLKNSLAGVVFIPPHIKTPDKKNYLVIDQPSLAFQKVMELFIKPVKSGFQGIHLTAVIHSEAQIGNHVTIGPYVVIDRNVIIGDRCTIGAHTFIGAEAVLGKECHIHPRVTIHDKTVIGNRVVLQSGSIIGSSGFGYVSDKEGNHHHLNQLGHVVLEDDVEIGANTTIDRARFKETRIGKGTKIDNLVQIAHQVNIGENNLIVAQVGIAGSTKTGKNVILAGQVGIVGHVTIGDNVVLAARSALSKSLLKGGIYSGAPAVPVKEFNEQIVYVKNIKKLVKRLEDLEKKLLTN